MAGRGDKVGVVGLRELVRDLKAADPLLAKELTKAQRTIAEKVVDRAQARARAEGGIIAKAADAFEAKGEQRYAKVVLNGHKHPFVYGGEFGAKQYPQFEPWRGNQFTDPLAQNIGYALFPTLREMRGDIVDEFDDLVNRFVKRLANPRG